MARKKRAIVSVTNDLYTDNRVNKICLFLEKQGYDVLLVGRRKKDSVELPPRSYQTKRFKLAKEKGAGFYALYNLRLFFFLLTKQASLLVSNDLDTLLANYAASKFKPNARLVYDSHEYFTEVPELIHRPRVQKVWVGIESWIFPKLKTIYTVNESIAQIYRDKYRKDVLVVRNISPSFQSHSLPSKSELGIPENTFLIIIQGAGINVDRGSEEAIEAMKMVENACLMIVGDGDVVTQLKKTVEQEGLSEKVRFYGKRPYAEMMAFTQHADVGLTLDKPTNMNYLYSLPNKVFDYIHASTPIIATDLVEIKRVIEKHELGTVLTELTPENLAYAIRDLQENPIKLAHFKANCEKASTVENWENEQQILEEIYPTID
jgi:glycosyltransferase involved in cell wall biosynthesis